MGDATVQDIRAIRYESDGNVSYKLRHSQPEWEKLPQRRNLHNLQGVMDTPNLYSEPLPLAKSKWNDLQQMKSIMPTDYHPFYDSLVCRD